MSDPMTEDPKPAVCDLCQQEAPELCHDGVCRACHKVCSLEDCMSGAYQQSVMAQAATLLAGLR